jgi:predicted small secreted protein
MSKYTSLSLIKCLCIVALTGVFLSACSNMLEGLGKDMQNMGASMGGSNNSQTNNQSQTKGKDVVVTPVQ